MNFGKDDLFHVEKYDQIMLSSVCGHEEIIEKCLALLDGCQKGNQMKWNPNCQDLLPRTVMLTGRSGNGKTMLVHALANHLNINVIPVSASNVASNENELEKFFNELLKFASKKSPAIIFFDKIDSIFDEDELATSAMLHFLEKFQLLKMPKMWIFAATSRVLEVKDDLISRFEESFHLDPPSASNKIHFLEMLLEPAPGLKLSEKEKKKIGHLTCSYFAIQKVIGSVILNAFVKDFEHSYYFKTLGNGKTFIACDKKDPKAMHLIAEDLPDNSVRAKQVTYDMLKAEFEEWGYDL